MKMNNSTHKGRLIEELAVKFLKKNNLKLIFRNFYTKYGEIDIIMQAHDDELVFAEVRYRHSLYAAQQSINKKKILKIFNASMIFLAKNSTYEHMNCRFDFILAHGNINNIRIKWLKNAFNIHDLANIGV